MPRSAWTIQNCLAIMVTIGFFAIIAAWMYKPPQGDGASIAVLNTLTGMMGAAFGGIITYFFGSSSGSREKDDTIKAMKTIVPPEPVVAPAEPAHAPPAAP